MSCHDPEDEDELREARAVKELRRFSVDWDAISPRQLQLLKSCLRSATSERELQVFLQKHRKLLIQHLRGGWDRWVMSQPRFGAEYVPDFVIGEMNSLGFHWCLVELESPETELFTKAGTNAKSLSQAIRQIQDWRRWLNNNSEMARRVPSQNGLGLRDIDANVPGLILIGRRKQLTASDNERRKHLIRELKIEIHTYDFLVSSLESRLKDFGKLASFSN